MVSRGCGVGGRHGELLINGNKISVKQNEKVKCWNLHFSLGTSFPISIFSPKHKNKTKKKILNLSYHLTNFVCQMQKPEPFFFSPSYQQHLTLCTIYSFIKRSYSLLPRIYIYLIGCYFPVFFAGSCTVGSNCIWDSLGLVLSLINPLISLTRKMNSSTVTV